MGSKYLPNGTARRVPPEDEEPEEGDENGKGPEVHDADSNYVTDSGLSPRENKIVLNIYPSELHFTLGDPKGEPNKPPSKDDPDTNGGVTLVTTNPTGLGKKALEALRQIIKGCKEYLGIICDWLESFWETAKYIPLANLVIGTVRIIRQVRNNEYCEAGKTLMWWVGGALGTAVAIIPLCTVLGPTLSFIGFCLASPIQNAIGGFGNLVIQWMKGELVDLSRQDIFERVYQDVARYSPLIAGLVCPFKCLKELWDGKPLSAKATFVDFAISVIAIGIACGLTFVDWNAILPILKTGAEATSNALVNFFSRMLLRFAPTVVDFCQTISSTAAYRVRISRSKFPFDEPNFENFVQCLQNPYGYEQVTDSEWEIREWKQGQYAYVMNCLLDSYSKGSPDYVNRLVGSDTMNEGHSPFELACKGGDPVQVQCILAFHPKVVTTQGWSDILPRLQTDSNPCIQNVLNGAFLTGTNAVGFVRCCEKEDNHRRIRLADAPCPVLNRPTTVTKKTRPYKVLCIDGGGTRGIHAIIQLMHICKSSPLDCFDFFVGTSTGALIILYLAAMKKQLPEILHIYLSLCKDIFENKLGAQEIEKRLQEQFDKTTMKDIPPPMKVLITTTTIKNGKFEPRFITNFHKETQDLLLWKVARRTTAVPLLMPPVLDESGTIFLDGGLLHNNPVLVALRHLRPSELENATIVSIGTGVHVNGEQTDFECHPSPLTYLPILLKCLIKTATDANGEVLEAAKYICNLQNAHLFRLNPSLPEKIGLDEFDYAKLVNGIWATESYVRHHQEVFQEVAQHVKP